jgi:hypothetical protein
VNFGRVKNQTKIVNKKTQTQNMNKLAKAAVVVAGLALVSQVAQAANNDLLLGFTGNGASSDYVINLGNASSVVGVGSGSVVNLSSDFNLSTFNSTFSSVNGTMMGVGGGTSSLNPVFFYTQNRGLAGDSSAALSGTPPTQTAGNVSAEAGYFNGVIGAFSSLGSAGGSATIANNDPNSFTSKVTSGAPGSLLGDKSLADSSAIGSGVIYEDLWEATKVGTTSSKWTYTGYFTFDTTGSSPLLTFTAAAVPEPSTYGLLGGAGLLVVAARRQFNRKNA